MSEQQQWKRTGPAEPIAAVGETEAPLLRHDGRHTRPIASRLVEAGLVENAWHAETQGYFDRLRGTVREPRMIVRHPMTDSPLDDRVDEREHPLEEAIALLADPNGPEQQLRARREAVRIAAEEQRKRDAELEARRARDAVQARWSAMQPLTRALWLVAARTKHRNPSFVDNQPMKRLAIEALIVERQQSFVAALALAIDEAESKTAPDDVIGLPDFNSRERRTRPWH